MARRIAICLAPMLRLAWSVYYKTSPEDLAAVTAVARAVRTLAGAARVEWFEQPLGKRNLEGLRALRRQTGLPVMADESCQTLRDAYELARAEAADVWNVYVAEAGGLRAAADIFSLGAAVGVPCILGSQAEMGIATAACAHLAVALPWLPYAIETFGPLRYERDIITGPGMIAGGWLTPPPGPGLGVELDWEAVKSMMVEI